MLKSFWRLLTEHVLSPRVDSTEVEERMNRASANLPKPVVWMLGKTQSGKTSIIRAITGSSHAEVGNGFRSCTRTARLYSFPSEEDCLLRFLDTRGLGEASYDPTEDITYCQEQAHLLMVVVRAMDHAQAVVHKAARAVLKLHPEWPVIVIQTTLHDGYPPGAQHPLPYPFDTEPWPESVPNGLARSLEHQRKEFADLTTRFVAVDLTLPEDGMLPEFYGLESLWAAIEAELPFGLRAMLQRQPDLQAEFADLYFSKAWPHIVAYSLMAGGAAAVPLVDVPLVVLVDAKMFHSIASIYGQSLTFQLMTELSTAIGTRLLLRLGGHTLLSLIPGWGTTLAMLYSAATAFALGCTLCYYFTQLRNGSTPSADQLRQFYSKQLEEGVRRFRDTFKRRGKSPPPSGESPPSGA